MYCVLSLFKQFDLESFFPFSASVEQLEIVSMWLFTFTQWTRRLSTHTQEIDCL